MLIVMGDDVRQASEAAVVVKTAFRVGPEPSERRRTVTFIRRAHCLKVVDSNLGGRMHRPAWFGEEGRYVTAGAVGFDHEHTLPSCSGCFVEASLRWLWSDDR